MNNSEWRPVPGYEGLYEASPKGRVRDLRTGFMYPPFEDYKSWGFINKKGEWIIQPAFDRIGSFKNGLAMMEMGNDIVYINTEGVILYRFQRGY